MWRPEKPIPLLFYVFFHSRVNKKLLGSQTIGRIRTKSSWTSITPSSCTFAEVRTIIGLKLFEKAQSNFLPAKALSWGFTLHSGSDPARASTQPKIHKAFLHPCWRNCFHCNYSRTICLSCLNSTMCTVWAALLVQIFTCSCTTHLLNDGWKGGIILLRQLKGRFRQRHLILAWLGMFSKSLKHSHQQSTNTSTSMYMMGR